MHTLEYPAHTGHVTINWDPSNDDEVETAQRTFDALRDRGFRAFHIKDDGAKGKRMDRFDPAAEKITLVAPLAGG